MSGHPVYLQRICELQLLFVIKSVIMFIVSHAEY